MIRAMTFLVLAIVAGRACAQSTAPQVGAYLQTDGQVGHGLLVQGPAGCVVLTVNHVVEAEQDIDLAFTDGRRWQGRRAKHVQDVAIVVPIVTGAAQSQRCALLPAAAAVEAARLKHAGMLMVTEPGGGLVQISVTVLRTDSDEIRIQASDPAHPLLQGMSGAPLMLDGVVVGVFRAIKEDQDGRPGIAVPIETVIALLGPVISVQGTAGSSPATSLTDANQMLSLARESRPSADMGQSEALQALSAAGKEVSGVDLASMGFGGAGLTGLVGKEADFTLSNLAGATLDKADLSEANFTLGKLDKANFAHATLARSVGSFQSAKGALFSGANLRAVGWRGADLSAAQFGGADLQGASFSFSNLANADFRGARFQDLVLIGSDLRGARFDQASARSIDVTGALFEDATFPAGLKPALCATQTTDSIELVFRENLTASPKTRDQINDLTEGTGGTIRLRHRADRFFRACPSRAGLLGRDYDAMIDFPGQAGEREQVHGRINVSLPAAYLKNEARKEGAIRTVKAVVADAAARDAALDTSNSFYRDRPRRLLAEVEGNLAAAKLPQTMWLTETTLLLAAHKYGLRPLNATEVIASRFLSEKAKDMLPPERRKRDNWTALFPDSMTSSDFLPPIQAAVLSWAKTSSSTLPSSVRIGLAGYRDETARFENVARTVTLDKILEPYESALHDDNFQRRRSRENDCFKVTNPSYDPADYPRAQKRMNYFGRSKDECVAAADAKVDVVQLLGGSWYQGRRFLELTSGGDDVWTLALSQPPPAAMVDGDGRLRAGIIGGRIVRVVKLASSGKVSVFSDPATADIDRKIIVLDDVTFTTDR